MKTYKWTSLRPSQWVPSFLEGRRHRGRWWEGEQDNDEDVAFRVPHVRIWTSEWLNFSRSDLHALPSSQPFSGFLAICKTCIYIIQYQPSNFPSVKWIKNYVVWVIHWNWPKNRHEARSHTRLIQYKLYLRLGIASMYVYKRILEGRTAI